MFFDWIMGVALRPRATFGKAREQLRFGYWWIVLTVMSLEIVVGIFRPKYGFGTEGWADAAFYVVMFDLLLFDIQALVLLFAARSQGWSLTWPEATKWSGLAWSIIFLEDVFTFYPALKGIEQLEMWISAGFSLWYVVTMAIGIRQVSGLSTRKSLLVTLLGVLTWRAAIFALTFYSMNG